MWANFMFQMRKKRSTEDISCGILISTYKTWYPCFNIIIICVHIQSCPTLCDPMDCSLPGSSVHGVPQANIIELVSMSSSRGSYWPRDWSHVSCISCMGRQIFHYCATWEAQYYNYVPFYVYQRTVLNTSWKNSKLFESIWILISAFLKLVSILAKFSINRPTINPSLKKCKKRRFHQNI